jgi:hypothetical protein
MTTKEPLTLVELDVPVCSLTYGTAPCAAALGVTGDIKCFNSIRTCQDRANFTRDVKTARFVRATQGLAYDAIPSCVSVSTTPPEIDPGRGMGVRASVSASFADHPTGDALFDKYIADRGYDPFARGTFWPKFRARFPSIEGAPLRILRGYVGDALEDFAAEHYFVTGMALDPDGVKITAKDSLSFCDPKKAQCPVPSTGKLSLEYPGGDASHFDVVPSGIGDEEYAEITAVASGYVCLSNKEILHVTRVADTFTVLSRNQFGSGPVDSHDEDSVVQLVKIFDAQGVADIVYSLLVDFTPGIDAAWCDLPTWQTEAETYIGHLYTGVIPAPTSVETLVNELAEQAGVSIWGDTATNTIQFRTLRPVTPDALVYGKDHVLGGSFKTRDQPKKRISLAITYYGVANAVEKVDKEPNFRASDLTPDAEADQDYDGIPAIQKNFSRWITVDNRAAASRLNNMQLSRFRDPPREFAFSLFATHPAPPALGAGIFVASSCLQDGTGEEIQVPAIVTSRTQGEDGNAYEAEELNFAQGLVPGTDRSVFIDTDHFNINLRDLYDDLYGTVPYGAAITFYLSPGAWLGSLSGVSPSLTVGDWPEATELFLVVAEADDADAQILGHGGDGGGYPGDSLDGGAGSGALYTRYPITILNYGKIGGGGGGGGGMIEPPFTPIGGGGGAGFSGYTFDAHRMGGQRGNGSSSPDAQPGGTATGGNGATSLAFNDGGDGGDLGAAGDNSDGVGLGGPGGYAIDGWSYVTMDPASTGSIVGVTIN